jgi:hypothetical protein
MVLTQVNGIAWERDYCDSENSKYFSGFPENLMGRNSWSNAKVSRRLRLAVDMMIGVCWLLFPSSERSRRQNSTPFMTGIW